MILKWVSTDEQEVQSDRKAYELFEGRLVKEVCSTANLNRRDFVI